VADRRLAVVALVLLAAVVGLVVGLLSFARRLAAVVSQPMEITNDAQLINDTVIRDGAMTWDQICTPAYERFCPPPSERQGG